MPTLRAAPVVLATAAVQVVQVRGRVRDVPEDEGDQCQAASGQ
jgi:hypothetical protein